MAASRPSPFLPASPELSSAELVDDPRRLSLFLSACGALTGYCGPLNLRQFGFGQSNPTFLARSPTHTLVVRKKPPGRAIASAHAVDREYRVISALWKHGSVPVPEPIAECTDASVIGSPFYLMRPLSGRIFTDPAMPGVSVEHRRACWHDAIRVLAAIHSTPVEEVGLSSFGKSGGRGYYARQLRRLAGVSRQQSEGEGRADPLPRFEAMTSWLEANLPEESGSACLVHGDYKIDNLVFGRESPRVVGVLDWELSTLGHPLSDVANLVGTFSYPRSSRAATAEQLREGAGAGDRGVMVAGASPAASVSERLSAGRARGTSGPSGGGGHRVEGLAGLDELAEVGIPSEEEVLELYCSARGVAVPLGAWSFAKAFFYFKYAVIAQGIADRAERGVASSKQARKLGALAPLCANLAMQLMGFDDSEDRPHRL